MLVLAIEPFPQICECLCAKLSSIPGRMNCPLGPSLP
jgi:hypothetical protein